MKFVLPLRCSLLAGLVALGAPVFAQQTASPPASTAATGSDRISDAMWTAAKSGLAESAVVGPARALGDAPELAAIRSSTASFAANLTAREELRVKESERVTKELDEALALEPTSTNLSKALKSAVELHVLAIDKPAVLRQERIQSLIKKAETAGRIAEADGDWLAASTLYGRLNILLEDQATYKSDVRRLGDRLTMIRLYAPERLYELRNKARLQEGLKPLPKYNAVGEDFAFKLKDVTPAMVYTALVAASEGHIEAKGLRNVLLGSLESVRTMATTTDLRSAFPGLGDDARRAEFVELVDRRLSAVKSAPNDPDKFELQDIINDVLRGSAATVQVPPAAILHEMGNGGFDRLDEFSQIIWPDELARFNRLMTSQFIGVGVQIQLDDETQMIKVVSPLEGTPAFRAGIKAGDFIKKIDEKDAVGMNIDQAVEQITGRAGTKVVLTMEREGKDLPFDLRRESIPLRTAKGWRREGIRDNDWDWYIDPSNKIGYIRLTQFQPSTTAELHRAIDQLQARGGCNGLILDLRFNPGGLLDQAVSVANTFIDQGLVVSTKSGSTKGAMRVNDRHFAQAGESRLGKTPLVVLINEGSASASEIVSGALRYYADKGKLDAVVIGARSYGKGSEQTVTDLGDKARMKLTRQYYFLPDDRLIHRRDHSTDWGVEPHFKVEMLPK
ncbi:MAG: S41 family peptidase, partial [Phycisphaerales bacterium]